MTEKNVVEYDPSRLMDAVRDRIKAEFVGLIPEDAWKEMVKSEVDNFLAPRHEPYNNQRELPSLFQGVVLEELKTAVKAKMKEYLESKEWATQWGGQPMNTASEAVRKLVVEKSGEIMANVLGASMQAAVENLKNQLRM